MIILFNNARGRLVFYNIGAAYFKIHKVYPKTYTELPAFVNSLGYACGAVSTKVLARIGNKEGLVEAKGIEVADEDSVAFILRFGTR